MNCKNDEAAKDKEEFDTGVTCLEQLPAGTGAEDKIHKAIGVKQYDHNGGHSSAILQRRDVFASRCVRLWHPGSVVYFPCLTDIVGNAHFRQWRHNLVYGYSTFSGNRETGL